VVIKKKLTAEHPPVVGQSNSTWLAKRIAAHCAVAKVLSEAVTLKGAAPKILRQIGEALDWEIGIFWRVDNEAQVLVCEELWSSPALKVGSLITKTRNAKLPMGTGLPGRVWDTRELIWVDDYANDNTLLPPSLVKENMHGAVCIPIKLKDHVLGAMEFISQNKQLPDQNIRETLTGICTQVGLFMERIHVAEALRESEARYRLLANTDSDVLVTFDEDGILLFVNQSVEHVFGYVPNEVVGKNMTLLIPDFAVNNFVSNSGGEGVSLPKKYVELRGMQKNGFAISIEANFAMFLGKGKKYCTGVIRDISERKNVLHALRESERQLRSVLAGSPAGQIVAESPPMLALFDRVKKAAASYAGILIQGETGSGKECIALALHQQSPRADKAFVARNCAAIPANLFESEMFGHKKGSFTGADRDRKGAFLEADGGTLFLDEIGDLEYSLQTKLLRAIQEKVIRPVGFDHDVAVDPRIICATNKDLRERCKTNEFREDLYYRLVTVVLIVPPLRERKEDIIPLARHFLGLASKWSRTLSPEAEERLLQHSWPGNVRELRSMMEQAVIFAAANEIQTHELNFPGMVNKEAERTSLILADVERRHILKVLKNCNGNKTEAAQLLGLARSTLLIKLKCYLGDLDNGI
jgi:two-component system response regulator HydG